MSDFSNIIQEINENLPDNTTQAITAKKLRDTLVDLTDTIEVQQDNFETSAMTVINDALEIVEDGVRFKSGQIVNDVGIINNTYSGSSNDVLSAELGQKTAMNVGKPDFTEIKLENYTAYQGRILLSTNTSPKIGNRTNTNFNYIIVDVDGVTSVRFRGCTLLPENDESGWAFYDERNYDPETTEPNDGGFLVDSTGFINFMQYDIADNTPQIKEYIVDVPEGAKYMKLNSKYFDGSLIFGQSFYCYLRYGRDVADTLIKKVNSDNTIGIFKWKKNLLNPSEFINGSIETPSVSGSTPVLTNTNSLLSNKLYLDNNETYTLSDVSIYKSGELYYFMVFEFDENDVYLGYKRFLAEKTSTGNTSYGEIGKRTLTYKKAYSACAYQRIRIRYAVLPTNPTFENWKTAQVEIGKQQTEYAPYHSEMYFPPLTTTMAADGTNLGNCSYLNLHNLEEGLNVEDNMGTSSKYELIKYDANGSEAVYVSGEYAKGYYTLYPYLWADSDGNKIENVTSIATTKTKNSWNNVRLYVPDGAKYLYCIAFGTKINTYKFELVKNYDGLSLPDYIENVINSNNEALKETMKKTVNILAIGNSYTQDSLMYVPFLMQNFDVNVNMTVLMKSSSTLSDAYNSFINESDIYQYQYYRAETDDRWHTLGTSRLFTIQKALDYNIEYDIILLNVSYDWGLITIERYNKLTSMIADYLEYPVKFGCLQVLIHRSAVNTHNIPDMPSLWDSAKEYALQDFVLYNNKIYWAKANNSNKVPTNTTYWEQFYKDWSETTRYSQGTIVYDNNVMYVSNKDNNIGNKPSSSVPTYWHYYNWDERYTYRYLDNCMYRGRVYVSRVEGSNTGNQPDESPVQWMYYNRPYTESQFENYQNSQISSCTLVNESTLCEDIIPVNAAIKNAYTVDAIKSIGSYLTNISNTTGYGWLLADDGFHLQEGLPCQLSAYAVCAWLLKKIGMDYKGILGDNTMATAEWLSDKYIQGQQGLPCGYDSTNEENNRRLKFIQKCAVMANKFPYETKDMNIFYSVE